MNNIEQAISFARQEYTRQGLDALYQKDFEEALLPALSQAAEIYRADTLRWSGDPKTDLLAALLWSQKLLNDIKGTSFRTRYFIIRSTISAAGPPNIGAIAAGSALPKAHG